jgi:dTMP kinase
MTRFEIDEEHGLDFHERVRAGYLELAAEDPERWRVIDGSQDPATVARAVVVALADVLPLDGGEPR